MSNQLSQQMARINTTMIGAVLYRKAPSPDTPIVVQNYDLVIFMGLDDWDPNTPAPEKDIKMRTLLVDSSTKEVKPQVLSLSHWPVLRHNWAVTPYVMQFLLSENIRLKTHLFSVMERVDSLENSGIPPAPSLTSEGVDDLIVAGLGAEVPQAPTQQRFSQQTHPDAQPVNSSRGPQAPPVYSEPVPSGVLPPAVPQPSQEHPSAQRRQSQAAVAMEGGPPPGHPSLQRRQLSAEAASLRAGPTSESEYSPSSVQDAYSMANPADVGDLWG